jgi:hypothetical protein
LLRPTTRVARGLLWRVSDICVKIGHGGWQGRVAQAVASASQSVKPLSTASISNCAC